MWAKVGNWNGSHCEVNAGISLLPLNALICMDGERDGDIG